MVDARKTTLRRETAMKRHPALVPLTHDHHHGLAQVRRMRLAVANGEGPMYMLRAREFLDFFADQLVVHFREEEELLFPLLVPETGEAPLLIVQAMTDHLTIRKRVMRLEREVEGGRVSVEALTSIAALLEAHIRLEERELFPLLEATAAAEDLEALELAPRQRNFVIEEGKT
jgi:hemerythrin-like domain-containing protein